MPNVPITVIELSTFLSSAKSLISDDERLDIVTFLAENPESGVIVPETGGVRKIRWARKGHGKRGSFRVIYYFHSYAIPIFLLGMYGKNEKPNITKKERNEMKKLTAILAEYGEKQS